MTKFDQIQEDMKNAMRNGLKDKVQALRLLYSEIKNEAVNSASDRQNIPDEVVLKVLDKAVKNRKESAKVYRESNRADLAEVEEKELEYLAVYLPEQLSDEELQSIVEQVKNENPNIQGMALMGKIMPLVKGKADPEAIKKFL